MDDPKDDENNDKKEDAGKGLEYYELEEESQQIDKFAKDRGY